MELKFKVIEEGKLPIESTKGAACFDFFARKIEMKGENMAIVYLGVAADIPFGGKIVIQPRSSFTFSGWVMANSPAQIDEDYKLEIQMRIIAIPNGIYTERTGAFNEHVGGSTLSYPKLPFKVGDRVCQGYLTFKTPVEIVGVNSIEENGRGGFGHTGK